MHPLFDPNSAYRIAMQETIFNDGGHSSVRRFFYGLKNLQEQNKKQEEKQE